MQASTSTVNLIIDGQTISVPKGTTVYAAAKQMGIDIPIFCYMDRMPPFGACRMCLVEVEKMPKLQASCTLEATEGMIVKTQSNMAVEGRKEIVELLLINHPLDCPICDRGGECPLQEHTLQHGPGKSKFFEEKRRFKKPLPLGPVLMLDRERCIICARCTRFGDIIAGDHALEFIERGYRTEVGTPDGGPAESKFIGNTIMICPVGALTSQVYRFRARPWDNEPTKSTCSLCPVGCSLILDSRDGEIMRTRSCENREVNDIWLCDKGWFGYEFTSHPNRLQRPLIRRGGKLEPVNWNEALSFIAKKFQEAKPSGKIAAMGGNPLTLEENYLFQKLIREVGGVNHLDHRIGMPIMDLNQEGLAPGMETSIGDCEKLSFAIICGADLTEEFPVIWLRLRQAINQGATVIFMGHFSPEIAQYFSKVILHAPGEEVEIIKQHSASITELSKKGSGALFIGRQYLANAHRSSILSELMKLNLPLNILEGRGNSMGARTAGMRPDLAPNGKQLSQPGYNAIEVLQNAVASGWEFLYVAGANPAKQFPSKLWEQARAKTNFLVVQDLFLTETAQQADVVLPTLSFVEKGGSFINIEGRLQKLLPGKEIPNDIYSDAEIFVWIAQLLNFKLEVDADFLKTDFRIKPSRMKSIANNCNAQSKTQNLLSATFVHYLFDQGVRMKHNPHVIQLAKEPAVRIHPNEGIKRSLNHGDIICLKANGNSITAKLKFDKKVSEGTIVLPLGFDEIPVHELGTNLLNGLNIEICSKTLLG